MSEQKEISTQYITDDRLDFLWAACFGVAFTDLYGNKDEALKVCTRSAYRDLRRTLRYSISVSDLGKMRKTIDENGKNSEDKAAEADKYDKTKKEFVSKVVNDIISKSISEYLQELVNAVNCKDDKTNWEDFTKWHMEICDKIVEEAENYQSQKKERLFKSKTLKSGKVLKPFYHGQAQKWLNMTLKNMLIMGLWDNEIEKVKPFLHVPVDDYIIDGADESFNGQYKLREPIKKSKTVWSQWEKKEYYDFQKHIWNDLNSNSHDQINTPIDWEGKVWLEVRKLRGEKDGKHDDD